MFPQYFWASACDLLHFYSQNRRSALLFFLLAFCSPILSGQTSANVSSQDESNRHYQAARTFGVVGDLDHAALEYRAFLGEALHQMANARTNGGKFAEAAPLFEEAISLEPDDMDLRLDYGSALLHNGNEDRAKPQTERAVELHPENGRAQYLLGRVFFEQGDYQKAKEHLEAAVKDSGGDAAFDVGYDLATTYLKLNDFNRAGLIFDEMMVGMGNTAQIHVYFGHAYLMTDQYDRAISEFKTALEKDPHIKEAHYFLGLSYLSRDEGNGWEENATEDRAEIQNNPDDYRPHFDLANVDLKINRLDEAEREFKRASEIQPENPDPLIALGELFAGQRRLPEAEAAMTRAIALTKDLSRNQYQVYRAYYVLGRVQIETGKREEGVKNLKTSTDLRDKAQPATSRGTTSSAAQERRASEAPIRIQDSASHLTPDQQQQLDAYFDQLKPAIGDAYNNLGVASASHKDFSAAMKYFREAGKWDPNLETLDRNFGMAAFYAGSYGEAIPPLYRLLNRNPNDDRLRTALGLSYFSTQNYQATINALQPIEQKVAADPGAGSAYAVALVKTGQYEQGMARLKSLEEANPSVAELHTTVGEVEAGQGIYASAIEEYKKALSLDPNQPRAHYLLGTALLRDGKGADAVPELRTALNARPSDPGTKYDLGLALLDAQQKTEALSMFQQVIALDSKYADAYYQIGKIELENGSTKDAIVDLERAAGLSPRSDYIHYQLSQAYGRDSRADDAKHEMEIYQTLKTERRGSHELSRSN